MAVDVERVQNRGQTSPTREEARREEQQRNIADVRTMQAQQAKLAADQDEDRRKIRAQRRADEQKAQLGLLNDQTARIANETGMRTRTNSQGVVEMMPEPEFERQARLEREIGEEVSKSEKAANAGRDAAAEARRQKIEQSQAQSKLAKFQADAAEENYGKSLAPIKDLLVDDEPDETFWSDNPDLAPNRPAFEAAKKKRDEAIAAARASEETALRTELESTIRPDVAAVDKARVAREQQDALAQKVQAFEARQTEAKAAIAAKRQQVQDDYNNALRDGLTPKEKRERLLGLQLALRDADGEELRLQRTLERDQIEIEAARRTLQASQLKALTAQPDASYGQMADQAKGEVRTPKDRRPAATAPGASPEIRPSVQSDVEKFKADLEAPDREFGELGRTISEDLLNSRTDAQTASARLNAAKRGLSAKAEERNAKASQALQTKLELYRKGSITEAEMNAYLDAARIPQRAKQLAPVVATERGKKLAGIIEDFAETRRGISGLQFQQAMLAEVDKLESDEDLEKFLAEATLSVAQLGDRSALAEFGDALKRSLTRSGRGVRNADVRAHLDRIAEGKEIRGIVGTDYTKKTQDQFYSSLLTETISTGIVSPMSIAKAIAVEGAPTRKLTEAEAAHIRKLAEKEQRRIRATDRLMEIAEGQVDPLGELESSMGGRIAQIVADSAGMMAPMMVPVLGTPMAISQYQDSALQQIAERERELGIKLSSEEKLRRSLGEGAAMAGIERVGGLFGLKLAPWEEWLTRGAQTRLAKAAGTVAGSTISETVEEFAQQATEFLAPAIADRFGQDIGQSWQREWEEKWVRGDGRGFLQQQPEMIGAMAIMSLAGVRGALRQHQDAKAALAEQFGSAGDDEIREMLAMAGVAPKNIDAILKVQDPVLRLDRLAVAAKAADPASESARAAQAAYATRQQEALRNHPLAKLDRASEQVDTVLASADPQTLADRVTDLARSENEAAPAMTPDQAVGAMELIGDMRRMRDGMDERTSGFTLMADQVAEPAAKREAMIQAGRGAEVARVEVAERIQAAGDLAIGIRESRLEATEALAQARAALPPEEAENWESLPEAQEVAELDAIRAAARIATGLDTADLTTDEVAGLEAWQEANGRPAIEDVNGVPVVAQGLIDAGVRRFGEPAGLMFRFSEADARKRFGGRNLEAAPPATAGNSSAPSQEGAEQPATRKVAQFAPGSPADTLARLAPETAPLLSLFDDVRQVSQETTGEGSLYYQDGVLYFSRQNVAALYGDNKKFVPTLIGHEFIHHAFETAMKEGRFGRVDVIETWQALGDTPEGRRVQNRVRRSYFAKRTADNLEMAKDKLGPKLGPKQKATDTSPAIVDSYPMMAELVRMILEDRIFAGQVSEAVMGQPKASSFLRKFLEFFAEFLRDGLAKLGMADAQTRGEIENLVNQTEEVYRALVSGEANAATAEDIAEAEGAILMASDRSGSGAILRTKSGAPFKTKQAAMGAKTKAEKAGQIAKGATIMPVEGGFEVWATPTAKVDKAKLPKAPARKKAKSKTPTTPKTPSIAELAGAEILAQGATLGYSKKIPVWKLREALPGISREVFDQGLSHLMRTEQAAAMRLDDPRDRKADPRFDEGAYVNPSGDRLQIVYLNRPSTAKKKALGKDLGGMMDKPGGGNLKVVNPASARVDKTVEAVVGIMNATDLGSGVGLTPGEILDHKSIADKVAENALDSFFEGLKTRPEPDLDAVREELGAIMDEMTASQLVAFAKELGAGSIKSRAQAVKAIEGRALDRLSNRFQFTDQGAQDAIERDVNASQTRQTPDAEGTSKVSLSDRRRALADFKEDYWERNGRDAEVSTGTVMGDDSIDTQAKLRAAIEELRTISDQVNQYRDMSAGEIAAEMTKLGIGDQVARFFGADLRSMRDYHGAAKAVVAAQAFRDGVAPDGKTYEKIAANVEMLTADLPQKELIRKATAAVHSVGRELGDFGLHSGSPRARINEVIAQIFAQKANASPLGQVAEPPEAGDAAANDLNPQRPESANRTPQRERSEEVTGAAEEAGSPVAGPEEGSEGLRDGEGANAGSGPAVRPDDAGDRAGTGARGGGREGASAGRETREADRQGAGNDGAAPDRQRPKPGSPGRNHVIRKGATVAPQGDKAKLEANFAAMDLLKKLEEKGRDASAEEKAQLVQFTGWGNFKEAFNDVVGDLADSLEAQYNGLVEQRDWRVSGTTFEGWVRHQPGGDRVSSWLKHRPTYQRLRETMTPEEFSSAARSTKNAHYTSPEIITAMWDIAKRLGFKGGKVLEPGTGAGHMIGLSPQDLDIQWTGVELDDVSARILAKLYPEAEINEQRPDAGRVVKGMGFESARITRNSQDMVIANVPFSEHGPNDPRYPGMNLHNYFLARSIDLVKPGGLVIAISTSGTMQNQAKQRETLAGRAKLVGAIRLPNNAFVANAGTEVTTDILIFRKDDGSDFEGQPWTGLVSVGEAPVTFRRPAETTPKDHLSEVALSHGLTQKGTYSAGEKKGEKDPNWKVGYDGSVTVSEPIMVNEYFVNNPAMALGEHTLAGTMYRGNEYANVAPEGLDTTKALNAAVKALPANIMGQEAAAAQEVRTAEIAQTEGAFWLEGDKPMTKVNGKAVSPAWAKNARQVAQFKLWSQLRSEVRDLIKLETTGTDDAALEAQRKRTAATYKALVGKHGNLAKSRVNSYRWLDTDPDYYVLASLETEKKVINPKTGKVTYSYSPAPILERRVIERAAEPTSAESVSDGVAISLSWGGRIDLAKIAKLTGKTEEQIKTEMVESDIAYFNPGAGEWQTAADYLSGNLYTLLDAARGELASDPSMARNIERITALLPDRETIENITAKPGNVWFSPEVYREFIRETFFPETGKEQWDKVGAFQTEFSDATGKINIAELQTRRAATDDYEVPAASVSGLKLLDMLIRNADLTIRREIDNGDGTKSSVIDQGATEALREKAEALEEAFIQWTRTTEAVMPDGVALIDHLEDRFNRQFNGHTTAVPFDGSHLIFPELNTDGETGVRLRPFRVRAVARMLRQRFGVIAHGVGTGKTFTQIILAHELKRLGIAKRPIIAVKNSTLTQFATSYMQAYPGARVLVGTKEMLASQPKRKAFLAQIATGEFDAIVMPHSMFDRLPLSEDDVNHYIDNELAKLREAQTEAIVSGASKGKQKDIKAAQDKLEKSRKDMVADIRKAQEKTSLTWSDFGADALLIDESHNYKRIPLITAKERLKGVPSDYSNKAVALQIKIGTIHKRVGGKRNVFGATGTPITNSMAEAWVNMALFAPRVLEERGLTHFDNWADTFGREHSQLEATWGTALKTVTRFSRFQHHEQLRAFMSAGMDIELDQEAAGLVLPKMRGGGPRIEVIPPSPVMEEFIQYNIRVGQMWDKLSPKERKEYSAIPICTMSAGIAAAVDPRLLNPNAPDDPGSKVNRMVAEALQTYRETNSYKGVQAIFADIRNSSTADTLSSFAGPILGQYKGPLTEFNLYDDIRAKLIAGGIDPEQIVTVEGSGWSADKLASLFNRLDSGEVRIVIGSTEKIGEGANYQRRLAAVHHMDPPRDKTPAKMEQRNGRILRQGNIHGIPREQLEAADRPAADRGGIDIVLWGVERSMDAAIYQLLLNKANFIKAAMTTGYFDQDALDEVTLSMAQMTALAMGNPDLIRKVELEERRAKLKNKKSGWDRDIAVLKKRVRDGRNAAKHAQSKLDSLTGFDFGAMAKAVEEAPTYEVTDGNGVVTAIKRQDYKGPDKKAVKATPVKDLDAWLVTQMDWRKDRNRRTVTVGGVKFAITVSELQERPHGTVMVEGTGIEESWQGGAGLALKIGKLLGTVLPGAKSAAEETVARSNTMADQAEAKAAQRAEEGWPGQSDLDAINEEMGEITARLSSLEGKYDVSVDLEDMDHADFEGPDLLKAAERSGTGFIMRPKSGLPYASRAAAKAARTKAERTGALAANSEIMETEGGFEIWGSPVDDSSVSAIEDLLTPPKEWRGLPDGHPLLTQTANEDGSLNKQTAVLPESSELVKHGFLPPGEHPRATLHDAIVAFFMHGKSPQAKREILFMAGGGAAGKSTYLRENPGKVPPEAVEVNADDIKALLPEFEEIIAAKDTRAALMVHEESSMLAKRVASEAIAKGLNVVYDATLAQPSKAVPLMQRFTKAGYKTRVVGLTVDPMLALQRSYTRFLEKGRWVPPDVLLGAHAEYNANIERYTQVADDYEVYESSHGSLRLILNQKNGKLRSKNEAALRKAGTYALLDPKGSNLGEVFAEVSRGVRKGTGSLSKGAQGAEVRLSGDLSRERYVSDALANLNRISRTAGGTIDASASPNKAAVFAGNADPAAQANENFTKLIGRLYDERAREFANPGEVLAFVDSINRDVNAGIVKDGVLLRTEDSPKYPYTRIKHIGAARKQFATELLEKMDSMDPVELAAWIHWRVNMTDHVYADGVGKTAEALADWALMRRGLPLPTMPDRKAWFKIAFKASPPDPKFPTTYNVGYTRFRRAFRGMFPESTPIETTSTEVEATSTAVDTATSYDDVPQVEFLGPLHPRELAQAGFPELAQAASRQVGRIGEEDGEGDGVGVREDTLRGAAVEVAVAAINAELPATRDRLLGILRSHPLVRVDERTVEATTFNPDLHFSDGGIPAGAPIRVVQPGYALTLTRLPGQAAQNRRPKSVMDGMRRNPDGTYNVPLVKARVERQTAFPAASPVPTTSRAEREARQARSQADQALAARLMREGGIVERQKSKETITTRAGVETEQRPGMRRNEDGEDITRSVVVNGWGGDVPDGMEPAAIPAWVQSGKTPAARQKRYEAAIASLARGWMSATGADQVPFAQALGELGATRVRGGYVTFDPARHVGRDGRIAKGRKVRMFEKGWQAPVWHDPEAKSRMAAVTKSVVTRAIEQGGEDGRVLRAAERTVTAGSMRLGAAERTVTPEMDAAYMAAVDRGDLEAAQRMVDKAARASVEWIETPNNATGKSKYAYVFSRGALLKLRVSDHANLSEVVNDSEVEAVYGRRYGIQNYTAGLVNILVKRPLGSRDARVLMQRTLDALPPESYQWGDFTFFDKPERHGYVTTVRIVDDVAKIEVADTQGDPVKSVEIFLNSAPPVTRDESGNIIPLSQRFNPGSDSILRAAEYATDRKIDDLLSDLGLPGQQIPGPGQTPTADPRASVLERRFVSQTAAARAGKVVFGDGNFTVQPDGSEWKVVPNNPVQVTVTEDAPRILTALSGRLDDVAVAGYRAAAQLGKAAGVDQAAKAFGDAVEASVVGPGIKSVISAVQPSRAGMIPELAALFRESERSITYGQRLGLDYGKLLHKGGTSEMLGLAIPSKLAADNEELMWRVLIDEKPVTDLPVELQELATATRAAIDRAGLMALQSGLITEETYKKGVGHYLPRLYLPRELERSTALGYLKSVWRENQDRFKQRLSDAYCIETVRSGKPTGTALAYDEEGRWRFDSELERDAYFEELMEREIAKKMDITINMVRNPRDASRRSDIRRVRAELEKNYRLRKPLTETELDTMGLIKRAGYPTAVALVHIHHDVAMRNLFTQIAQNADWASDQAQGDLVRLPVDRRLGPLSGMYVRPDIAEEIRSLRGSVHQAMRIYDTALAWWREGKTVLNPATHGRNVLTNFMFADFAGIAPWEVGRVVSTAVRLFKGEAIPGTTMAELIKMGVIGNDFASKEFRALLDAVPPSGKVHAIDIRKWPAGARDLARKLYRIEDEAFKVAAYVKAKEKGMTPEQAAAHVGKFFPDYSNVPKGAWVRMAKRTGVPFVSFAYESARIFGNVMAEKPMTLAKWMMMPQLVTAISLALHGLNGDDDDDREDRDAIFAEVRGPKVGGRPVLGAVVGMGPDGRPMVWDLTNVMPWASFMGQRVETEPGKETGWEKFFRSMVFGGPVMTLASAFGANQDAYTGRRLAQTGMTDWERFMARFAGPAWNTLAPAPITEYGLIPRAATAGDVSRSTLQKRTSSLDLLRSATGIDVRSAAPSPWKIFDRFSREKGYSLKPEFDDSTPQSRAKARLYEAIVNDDAGEFRAALAAVERAGNPEGKKVRKVIGSLEDLDRLIQDRHPVFGRIRKGDAKEFMGSLSPEEKKTIRRLLEEFSKVQSRGRKMLVESRRS
jgi:N12 class adenine-specific DNA methylase/predicted ABC-type ATPase